MTTKQKVKPVCYNCGSDHVHVITMNKFAWSIEEQDWDWQHGAPVRADKCCADCELVLGYFKLVPVDEPVAAAS